MADLTIDLGNYNTIVTFREHDDRVHGLLRGVAREVQEFPGALFVPSLVCIGDEVLLGEEVLARELYDDPSCFRDLRDHVLHPSPVARNLMGLRVTHKKAAATFLTKLVERLHRDLGETMNLVFLFPNVHGDLFRECLRYVDLGGVRSVTLLDEDTAAALGYGVNLFVDDLVLIFDFGFSSVRARVLQFHWVGREAYAPPVLKAAVSLPVGTADLRLRILKELHADEEAHELPGFYWKKFTLHGDHRETLSHERFSELLAKENLAARVQEAVDQALDEAALSGVRKEQIRKVLLLGGGTRIPLVRRTLDENFGDRVLGDLPELAPGRGGVNFLSDSPVDDMVRYTYSVQVRDPITGEYHYPVVVEKYTRYPTRNPTARYVVNTFYDGQYEVHVKLFRTVQAGEAAADREILFGDDGRISFVAAGTEEAHEPVTELPVVIPVSPPGRIGERRFLLEFRVDSHKRLLLTVKDLREERVLWEDRALTDLA
ncbi:MAG: Hsp70 family protein [Deferrisomatales bacterium]